MQRKISRKSLIFFIFFILSFLLGNIFLQKYYYAPSLHTNVNSNNINSNNINSNKAIVSLESTDFKKIPPLQSIHPLVGVNDLFFTSSVKKNKLFIKGKASISDPVSSIYVEVFTNKKTLKSKTSISDNGSFKTTIKLPYSYKISEIKVFLRNSLGGKYPFFLQSLIGQDSKIVVKNYRTNNFSKNLFDFAYKSDEGAPSHWDPCKTINYQINPANMPAYATSNIAQAFDILSKASGYSFTFAGYTDKIPFSSKDSYTDSTITIAFSSKETVPILKKYLALGGAVTNPVTNEIFAGSILVNVGEYDFAKGFSNKKLTLGRVLLHELGHAMNLTHVDSESEIMHEFILIGTGPTTYKLGDTNGLTTLHSLGCFELE